MLKVMSVFGTRPEAIKMAPLVKEIEKNEQMKSIVCVTAQHRQMLDMVLDEFDIKADIDLNIMKDGQTLEGITSAVITGICDAIEQTKPDIVLVHGDTTTSFAAALAAFYKQTSVGHVEAGLRTYDIYSPFPEELNRQLTGRISSLHFSPTSQNKENLLKENTRGDIFITGNTVIDAFKTTVKKEYTFKENIINEIDFTKKVIMLTAHRRENLGKPLEDICLAVKEIAEKYDDVLIVYPVHKNPKVLNTAKSILGDVQRVMLIDPIEVCDMHNFMDRCYMVLTDSGGLQEEAPALGKPVLVLRTETERPEAVTAGTVKMAGVVREDIVKMASELIVDENAYSEMAKAVNPYGDGTASQRICKAILYHFKMGETPDEFNL